jgi:hypothetical protein
MYAEVAIALRADDLRVEFLPTLTVAVAPSTD